MRKILIIALIITGFYSVSNAQARAGKFDFGANIGLNEGNLVEGGSLFTYTPVYRFNAAASLEYYFSDRWSFKGKLSFDQKGWSNTPIEEQSGSAFFPSVNHNLNYLTVPLMANWHFGKTRNWYLHFGPYLGFLLSARDLPGNIDEKSSYNSTDVGVDLGIGVKFPVSSTTNLFIEADGQGGATNIFRGTVGGPTEQNSRSSLNFGFNVAIK